MIEFNGEKLYDIDGIPTAITALFGNYAQGFTIEKNSIAVPCFVARVGNSFAHGETVREALADAISKDLQSKPLEARIADIIKEYPDINCPIPNEVLFNLHNVLTGSCKFGRKQFVTNHAISLSDRMTMADFIELTKNEFGGYAIKMLSEAYK